MQFTFSNNVPLNNSILVNDKSGKVIQKNGNPNEIYLTKFKNIHGWHKSFKLRHCINISGKFGGLKSYKGQPVIWNNLQDHTLEFNKLLVQWIEFFEQQNEKFENTNYINLTKLFFWYSMVDDNKPLDIKNKNWKPSIKGEWSIYNNTLMRYDDYGNILYGCAGAAFGLNERTLLFGGNFNQILKSGFDDTKDVYSIKRGIAIYFKYKSISQL